MRRVLLPLWGSLGIQSYGLIIALGVIIFYWMVSKDPRYKKYHVQSHFNTILTLGIVAGILGGKLLYTLTEPDVTHYVSEFFNIWSGGFSILGSVLGIFITLVLYLRYVKLPIIPLCDLFALYAPLLQSISRIGCFFAGCCYGIPTTVPWAVLYSDPQSVAPLHVCIHPTQLYSAFLLAAFFCVLYFWGQRYLRKPGQILAAYLIFIATERFVVDFWRADRVFTKIFPIFSVNQIIAFALIVIASSMFLVISIKPSKKMI